MQNYLVDNEATKLSNHLDPPSPKRTKRRPQTKRKKSIEEAPTTQSKRRSGKGPLLCAEEKATIKGTVPLKVLVQLNVQLRHQDPL
ncbi:hypothetical protein ACLOJK_013146 [Asimina triloba]